MIPGTYRNVVAKLMAQNIVNYAGLMQKALVEGDIEKARHAATELEKKAIEARTAIEAMYNDPGYMNLSLLQVIRKVTGTNPADSVRLGKEPWTIEQKGKSYRKEGTHDGRTGEQFRP